eukprot:TRINITY_DN8107_c0_g1_i4.p1 TRINITY_DN8107_c0_g1~~TRINITY_DN8107_c0_g1_i4.p1  ORF type:complete len:955 (+),score=149.12 TRINITY_DN8107_c0_g1_i4:113-2977(+)
MAASWLNIHDSSFGATQTPRESVALSSEFAFESKSSLPHTRKDGLDVWKDLSVRMLQSVEPRIFDISPLTLRFLDKRLEGELQNVNYKRFIRSLRNFSLFVSISAVFTSIVCASAGLYEALYFCIPLTILCLVIAAVNRNNSTTPRTYWISYATLFLVTQASILSSTYLGGFKANLSLPLVISVLFLIGIRAPFIVSMFWTYSVLASYGILLSLYNDASYMYSIYGAFVFALITILFINASLELQGKRIFRLNKIVDGHRQQIAQERALSQKALSKIYPAKLLDRLNASDYIGVTPRVDSDATIICCRLDRKGYSNFHGDLPKSHMPPYIVSALDQILFKFGFDRVKTVGNTYLATCGLFENEVSKSSTKVNLLASSVKHELFKIDQHITVCFVVHIGPVVYGILQQNQNSFEIFGGAISTVMAACDKANPDSLIASHSAMMSWNDHGSSFRLQLSDEQGLFSIDDTVFYNWSGTNSLFDMPLWEIQRICETDNHENEMIGFESKYQNIGFKDCFGSSNQEEEASYKEWRLTEANTSSSVTSLGSILLVFSYCSLVRIHAFPSSLSFDATLFWMYAVRFSVVLPIMIGLMMGYMLLVAPNDLSIRNTIQYRWLPFLFLSVDGAYIIGCEFAVLEQHVRGFVGWNDYGFHRFETFVWMLLVGANPILSFRSKIALISICAVLRFISSIILTIDQGILAFLYDLFLSMVSVTAMSIFTAFCVEKMSREEFLRRCDEGNIIQRMEHEQMKMQQTFLSKIPTVMYQKLVGELEPAANRIRHTSVLYVHFGNFNKIASELQPNEVFEFANGLFGFVRQLSDEYNFTAVKILDHGYLLLSSKNQPGANHAESAIRYYYDLVGIVNSFFTAVMSSNVDVSGLIGAGPCVGQYIGKWSSSKLSIFDYSFDGSISGDAKSIFQSKTLGDKQVEYDIWGDIGMLLGVVKRRMSKVQLVTRIDRS